MQVSCHGFRFLFFVCPSPHISMECIEQNMVECQSSKGNHGGLVYHDMSDTSSKRTQVDVWKVSNLC